MLGILRFINALGSLMVGWTTVVMSLLILIWLLWDFLAGPIIGNFYIAEPMPLLEFLYFPAWLGFAVLAICLIFFMLKPTWMVMRSIFRGVGHDRVKKDNPLYLSLAQIAKKMGVRPPKLFVYNSPAPNAFAVSSLFSSSIAVSYGMLQQLDREEIEWVLAHELAHVKCFDSGASSFWIASSQAMQVAWAIHRWMMRLVINSAIVMRLSLVFIVLLIWPLLILNYTIIFIAWVTRKCFLLFDLHIGRMMEYRSDRLASKYLSPVYGISALGKLGSGIEPSLGGLFSTHPPSKRRIRRLGKMA